MDGGLEGEGGTYDLWDIYHLIDQTGPPWTKYSRWEQTQHKIHQDTLPCIHKLAHRNGPKCSPKLYISKLHYVLET